MKKLTYRENLRLAWRYFTDQKRVDAFQKLTEDEIRKHQFQRIKKLLDIAYYHTNFYRRKYEMAGIKPEDIRSLSDFEKIPTVTKEELIAYNHEFIDNRVCKQNLIRSRSSGSSGKFVDIYMSADMFIEEELQVLRMLKSFNPGYCARDKEVLVYTSEYPVTSILGFYPVYYINNLLDANEIFAFLKKINPKIVAIYPSILRELLEIPNCDLSALGIQTIITNSEQSTQQERDYYAQFFGCDVFDEFSSEELQSIFYQCGHKHYHGVPDCTYIELLEENSLQPVAPGKPGEIVGTCLINEAMPIIRYRSGDLATESTETCPCGRTGRIYTDILGRKNASFRKPDGTVIPSGKILDWSYSLVLSQNMDIREFQFIQKTYFDIILKIVPGENFRPDRDEPMLVQHFRRCFGADYQLHIQTLDDIPKTPAGKHIPIISRL